MNYKRKKSTRNVRCTLCSKYRWLGNSKAKKRIRDLRHMRPEDLDEMTHKNERDEA